MKANYNEDAIKANDSYRTVAQKAKKQVSKLKKQKPPKATFSPDGGRTVFLFSSKKEMKEKLPGVIERYERSKRFN